ncbi:MAG: glycosyltransferase, partial [Planctomycetes bacterium]|nr:glycosyltransferase [Planctomycetota bacterium]
MDLSVVIVTWNTRELVEQCVESLLSELDTAKARFGVAAEVIVVDNGSIDGTAALLAQRFPAVTLIRLDENRGFAAGNNVGIQGSTGDYVVLLNNDTFVTRGWVADLIRHFRESSEVPIVLFTYLNPVYTYGFEAFHLDAAEAGADGVLLLDLPPDEVSLNEELQELDSLKHIRLIAPTTPADRIPKLAGSSEG